MKTRLIALLRFSAALLGLTATGLSQSTDPIPANVTSHLKLPFSPSDPELTLDLFLPSTSQGAVPCVIVIQGGGFKSQTGQRFRPFATHLAENGFAAALVSYRGLPDHTYQTTTGDIHAALAFVRRHADTYGINASSIGAMGRSAGATLAVLLAVGDHPDGRTSAPIQAAVGIAGVYDFVARFTDEAQRDLQPGLDSKLQSNTAWIGSPFSSNDQHWRHVSARHHVDPKDPPVLLLHCRDDGTVPWQQSRDLYDTMTGNGIAAKLEIVDEGGHRGPPNQMESMVTFFKRVLID